VFSPISTQRKSPTENLPFAKTPSGQMAASSPLQVSLVDDPDQLCLGKRPRKENSIYREVDYELSRRKTTSPPSSQASIKPQTQREHDWVHHDDAYRKYKELEFADESAEIASVALMSAEPQKNTIEQPAYFPPVVTSQATNHVVRLLEINIA